MRIRADLDPSLRNGRSCSDPIHDPGRVLPAEGGGERLELLLLLPVPAARAAPRHHRAVRLLPRGGRRRRRDLRPAARRDQARVVARRGRATCTPAIRSIRSPRRCRLSWSRIRFRRNTWTKSSTAWRWTSPSRATSTGRASSATATASPAWSACSPPASSATATRARSSTRTSLGIAFQLTNIIRDVGEDARKNRIYLPMDDLKRFGVPAADILNAQADARVPAS